MGARLAPAAPAARAGAAREDTGRSDFYWLRLPATGLCFLVFGLVALIIGLGVLPFLNLWSRNRDGSRRVARRVIAAGMRGFIHFMRGVGVMRFTFAGREKLGRPGQLIIANHPTLIDVVFLLGFTPNATCIVKAAMFTNPFTRAAVKAADYIPNAPTDEMVLRAERELREGQTLVVFPEGTRTIPGRALELQRGAANIALRGAAALTPVFISCEPPTLSKHLPWHRIPPRRAQFTLHVGDDIDVTPFRSNPLPRGSRQLNAQLASLFETTLDHGSHP